MEKTLIIVKPDAVQRGLVGEIVTRFEQRGLRIVGMKAIQIDEGLASRHYSVHKGKPFYEGLIKYITSSPVVVVVLEGTNAIEVVRHTFNLREGHNPLHVKVAARVMGRPPLESGPRAGVSVDIDDLRSAYLAVMDWDPESAMPSKDRLAMLGLEERIAG